MPRPGLTVESGITNHFDQDVKGLFHPFQGAAGIFFMKRGINLLDVEEKEISLFPGQPQLIGGTNPAGIEGGMNPLGM
jgi:hypothetical protein